MRQNWIFSYLLGPVFISGAFASVKETITPVVRSTTVIVTTISTISLGTTSTVVVTATTTVGFPYESTGPYSGCSLNNFSGFTQFTGDNQFEDAVKFCQESYCDSDPNCDFVYVQLNYSNDPPNSPAYYCYKNETPYTFDPVNSQWCSQATGIWGDAYAFRNSRSPDWR